MQQQHLMPGEAGALRPSRIVRLVEPDTISRDIRPWELARLMSMKMCFTAAALAAMSEEDRALVECNSREV